MLRKLILMAILALGFLGVDPYSAVTGDGGAALAGPRRAHHLAHATHASRHHGRRARFHHFRHFHHSRYSSAVHHQDFRAEATPFGQFASFPASTPSAPDVGAENRPLELHPLLAVAKRYVGRGNFTHHGGPWCRDAINVWLRQAGYHLANNSRRAIDALRLGHRVASPRPGDLVVMRHHVTIFAGWGGRGLVGLGGNQGHRVKYSHFSQRQVVAFVRP